MNNFNFREYKSIKLRFYTLYTIKTFKQYILEIVGIMLRKRLIYIKNKSEERKKTITKKNKIKFEKTYVFSRLNVFLQDNDKHLNSFLDLLFALCSCAYNLTIAKQ